MEQKIITEHIDEIHVDLQVDTSSEVTGLTIQQLIRTTKNPALIRLSEELENRIIADATNYSRMHNRHNRSHNRG